MPEFSEIGIPHGTLCSIANGYPIPKKWKKKLKVRDHPPRIAIRKDDMDSAARSILNNIARDEEGKLTKDGLEKVSELVDILSASLVPGTIAPGKEVSDGRAVRHGAVGGIGYGDHSFVQEG